MLLTWEVFDALAIAAEAGKVFRIQADQWQEVCECLNCGRTAVEGGDGYSFYTPGNAIPRVFVDRSVQDALGGYGLEDPRTVRKLAAQHVLLNPATAIIAYDDSGWAVECTIETWVREDQEFDHGRYVAREGLR